jgi:hypothetical protein
VASSRSLSNCRFLDIRRLNLYPAYVNRNERLAILVFIAFILMGFVLFWWRAGVRPMPSVTPPSVSVSTGTAASAAPSHPSVMTPPTPAPVPAVKAGPPKPATTAKKPSSATPAPPPVTLHKELIPKDITIVRCYYSQEVAPPGTTIGFDINGSGFTDEFQQMIKVTANDPQIRVKNLRLATANQIHGEMEVGAEAKTAFIYLDVLIKNLPVFRAPDPFAVIRKGEVLTVVFIQMHDNGRGGRFRVYTNLDDALAKDFRVEPSTKGIEISEIEPHLPFAVDGTLKIHPGVPPGDYGLLVYSGPKEIFHRDTMIHIVRPNVGQTGFIQGVTAEEPYHRPGDTVQLYLQGTGLSAADALGLQATVAGYDMGRGSFTYLSPAQLRLFFVAPAATPLGAYGITIAGPTGEKLYGRNDVFKIISANWIAGVQVTPPVHTGQKSVLKVLGRDLSADYMKALMITTDEPGITLSPLRWVDPSTVTAEISVSSSVAPGDYWLHLSHQDAKINPPYGSIIKVEKP